MVGVDCRCHVSLKGIRMEEEEGGEEERGFDQKLCARLEGCGKTQSTADPSENHSRHRLVTALSFLGLSPTTRGPTWQCRNRASNYVQCIFTSTLLVIYPSQQKHKNTILNEKPLANQISPLQSLLPSHFKYQPIPSRLDSPSLLYPSLA